MQMTLKNMILAGIGTFAYTYEKSMDMIDELVKKGELTVNQGKDLNEELKRKMNKQKECCDTDKECCDTDKAFTLESLKEVLASMNLTTKDDLKELKDRISKLENR
jgi:polyhydroxyalkanoate synthesis regulator phasin